MSDLIKASVKTLDEMYSISEEEKSSGLDHTHAKQVAKEIAKKHKSLRVTSFGKNEHYVHHVDDEDGNDTLKVHAEGGKIHLTRESGVAGHGKSSHDSIDHAIEAGKKHV